jgi:hypothetical protein
MVPRPRRGFCRPAVAWPASFPGLCSSLSPRFGRLVPILSGRTSSRAGLGAGIPWWAGEESEVRGAGVRGSRPRTVGEEKTGHRAGVGFRAAALEARSQPRLRCVSLLRGRRDGDHRESRQGSEQLPGSRTDETGVRVVGPTAIVVPRLLPATRPKRRTDCDEPVLRRDARAMNRVKKTVSKRYARTRELERSGDVAPGGLDVRPQIDTMARSVSRARRSRA